MLQDRHDTFSSFINDVDENGQLVRNLAEWDVAYGANSSMPTNVNEYVERPQLDILKSAF